MRMIGMAATDCLRSQIGVFERCSRLRETTGQALIELAFMVPIFVLLLIGAFEFATLEYAGIEVSHAARAGVAYGSQSGATAADISGMQTAATNDGPDVPGLSAVATEFWSCSDAPSTQSTSPPTCTTGNHLLNYVQVTTTATVAPAIQVPGLPSTYRLNGVAIMRVQ